MASGFIGDGYTQEAYFRGGDKLYPPVRFAFRPATTLERLSFGKGLSECGDNPKKADEFVSKFVAGKLLRWDLTVTKGGETTPLVISPENVARLHPDLQGRFFAVIMSKDTWDDLPDEETSAASRTNDPEADAKN